MNKESLFRGKRVDNDEWVYGDLIHRQVWCTQLTIIRISDDGFDHYEEFEVKPETVGEFTNLTDKNGKKIFENDIIADDEEYSTFENTRKGIVKFYHGEFTSFYGQDLLGRDCYDPLYSVCKERHVIGNIYDNPELEEE